MKHIKLLTFALLLIVGPVLIESCCWDCDSKCYVRKHKAKKFNIENIDLQVGIRYSSPYRLAARTSKASTIEFKFELKSKDLAYSQHQEHVFRPTMMAFAQDICNANRVESNQTLKSYSIVSNNILVTDKGTFQAGDDLVSVFYLTDGGVDTPFHDSSFTMYPLFVAKEQSEHIFTIVLEFNNEARFEMDTFGLELLPE